MIHISLQAIYYKSKIKAELAWIRNVGYANTSLSFLINTQPQIVSNQNNNVSFFLSKYHSLDS